MSQDEISYILNQGSDAWNSWVLKKYPNKEGLIKRLMNNGALRNLEKTIDQKIPIGGGRTQNISQINPPSGTITIKHNAFNKENIEKCFFPEKVIFDGVNVETLNLDGSRFMDGVLFRNTDIASLSMKGITISGDLVFQRIKSHKSIDISTDSTVKSIKISCATGIACIQAKININIKEISDSFQAEDTVFSSSVDLSDIAFGGDFNINKSTFKSILLLDRCKIKGNSFDCSATTFNDTVGFIGTNFTCIPDFRGAEFSKTLSLNEAKFSEVTPSGSSSLSLPDSCRSWCYLKKVMKEYHDREQELRFFSYEMDCKKALFIGKKDKQWILINLYRFFSFYGTSFIRPFVLWLCPLICILSIQGVLILKTIFEWKDTYQSLNAQYWFSWCRSIGYAASERSDAIIVSLSNLLPFVYQAKAANEVCKTTTEVTAKVICYTGISHLWVVYSTIMIFLMILAVKNRCSIS